MPFNLSTGEIVVLLIVAILVFGGRLPEVARKVARGVGDFRRGMNEEMRRVSSHVSIDEGDEVPPDWTSPPDGADCDGFGRIDPETEETPDVEPGETPDKGEVEEQAENAP